MNVPRHLFAHYRNYHEGGLRRLQLIGQVGSVSYTVFLAIRLVQRDWAAQDVVPRLLAIVLFVALGMRRMWPRHLTTQYIALSWVALAYGLSFFVFYDALQRQGGVPAMSNIFISLSLLVLLTDWRNTLAMLLLGTCAGTALHMVNSSAPALPHDLLAQAPAFAVIAIGGSLFKLSGEQVEAARQLRFTQMLAGSIAHEVRNPLAQVKHSLSSLRRMLPRMGAPQSELWSEQYVSEMHRHVASGDQAVRRGLQTISMTLDEVFDKPLEEQSFVRLSASELVRKALAQYAYDGDDVRARIKLRLGSNFHFRGDETACLFMLFNLIRNALYYLPPKSGAVVTITIASPDILIHDNGPGMSAKARARLFQPMPSIDRRRGTGLGLVYCKRVMTGMNGSITCDSAPGRFTEFRLTFPVVVPPAEQNLDCGPGAEIHVDPPVTEPPKPLAPLIDERRLREYRRVGFLDDFVGDYTRQLDVAVSLLVEGRDTSQESGNAALMVDAAHSLLSLSSEACTPALNERARELYALLNGGASWSDIAPQWQADLVELLDLSVAALRRYCEQHNREQDPNAQSAKSYSTVTGA